jgi:hypothetical protein
MKGPLEPYTTPKGWKPPSLQEQIAHFYRAHGTSKGKSHGKFGTQFSRTTFPLPCRPPVSLGLHRRRPTRPHRLGRIIVQQIISERGAPRYHVTTISRERQLNYTSRSRSPSCSLDRETMYIIPYDTKLHHASPERILKSTLFHFKTPYINLDIHRLGGVKVIRLWQIIP